MYNFPIGNAKRFCSVAPLFILAWLSMTRHLIFALGIHILKLLPCVPSLGTLLPKTPVTWQAVLFVLRLHWRPEINHFLLAWAVLPCRCACRFGHNEDIPVGVLLVEDSLLLLTLESQKVSLEHSGYKHIPDKLHFPSHPQPWKIFASFTTQVLLLCDLLINHHLPGDCLMCDWKEAK